MRSSVWIVALIFCLLLRHAEGRQGSRPCTEADYYYEYTECDSTGSRWRVAIPHSPGACDGLPEPVKGTECTFSCKAGEFLEMSAQECTQCAAGSYSLGSGIRFDQWDATPAGFSSLAAMTSSSSPDGGGGPRGDDALSCNSSSWVPQGSYMESNRDECTVSLIYAVHLKKQGSVTFEYQYPDNNLLFEFFIQNDQCQETAQSGDKKWLKLTNQGDWATHTVNLKSGSNVLYWRTGAVPVGSKVVKPVLLKNVQIEGVAYTSECFPCQPGTFSSEPGSDSCQPCVRDTHSGHGASSCTPSEGSGACKKRPPCSRKDYFQIHTACDSEGKTQIIYKWIEPKICLEGASGAVPLPPSGEHKPCPPCNPGFFNNDTAVCSPCPPGTYSDGTKVCKQCPAGTEPILGYEYKWWNVLPANIKTSCFNVGNTKCDRMNGWEVAGDHIQTGAGGSDNDYLILNIHIPGFKLPTSLPSSSSGAELGRIVFEFETVCSEDCELYFMTDVNRKSTTVVESWAGTKTRRTYTHIVTKNASVSYTWAFQRTNQAWEVRSKVHDVARIYSITVSNALDGQSSECRACALSSLASSSRCVPCPPGHYIDPRNSQCTECPPNTHLVSRTTMGPDTCRPCGPASRSSKEHSLCFSDCQFSHTEGNVTLSFDFSPMGSVGTLMNGPSFTSKGTKYFHQFNISLCGGEREKAEAANSVKTFICQSTIIPAIHQPGQHVSRSPQKVPDVNFFYRSLEPTSSCESGRSTVVTLRCRPEMSAQGELTVPSECPAGTCDGCTFHFLWESSGACPTCTEMDYHQIEGACKGEHQDMLYVWTEPKLCTGGVPLPEKRTLKCESMDFFIRLSASLGAMTAVMLVILTCFFWKKNKRLEYKYSRLVMSANKECEMPAADSCAVMEGEDNEGDMEDDVVYTKPSLLGKLKAIASKGKGDRYENVQLNSSHPKALVWS
ncbi:hypothetical protein NHX12_002570 [Muraenolepis orangiensis]|uniref:MRH domain-containing protein n=1 Tax=Muraenolepis orangiensis TaxID=630683 RepID=A0A9Q0DYQ3_9TELE|nr:hypothetical protein NHX12_002570 [Muraenolepis orangiensis]